MRANISEELLDKIDESIYLQLELHILIIKLTKLKQKIMMDSLIILEKYTQVSLSSIKRQMTTLDKMGLRFMR
jgi:hypothetical protein